MVRFLVSRYQRSGTPRGNQTTRNPRRTGGHLMGMGPNFDPMTRPCLELRRRVELAYTKSFGTMESVRKRGVALFFNGGGTMAFCEDDYFMVRVGKDPAFEEKGGEIITKDPILIPKVLEELRKIQVLDDLAGT